MTSRNIRSLIRFNRETAALFGSTTKVRKPCVAVVPATVPVNSSSRTVVSRPVERPSSRSGTMALDGTNGTQNNSILSSDTYSKTIQTVPDDRPAESSSVNLSPHSEVGLERQPSKETITGDCTTHHANRRGECTSLQELEIAEKRRLDSYIRKIRLGGWAVARSSEQIKQTPLMFISDSSTEFNAAFSHAPSVSRILEITQSDHNNQMLKNWRRRKYVEFGSNIDKLTEYLDSLKKTGSHFHKMLQAHFNGDQVDKRSGFWQSVEPVLQRLATVQFVEQTVQHKTLGYRGIVDCTAQRYQNPEYTFPGNRDVLVEWKTCQGNSKVKHTILDLYDYPLQTAAYIGAMSKQPISVLIVVAYQNGRPASVFQLTEFQIELYWKLWLSRLCSFLRKLESDGS